MTVTVKIVFMGVFVMNELFMDLDSIDMAIPYIDDNDLAYLANMDDDEMIYSTGHFDEQLLDNYWSAQDEDGNYIHSIDIEVN